MTPERIAHPDPTLSAPAIAPVRKTIRVRADGLRSVEQPLDDRASRRVPERIELR